MTTAYAIALFIACGVCGIISALLLRNRNAVWWQGALFVLAGISIFLVAEADVVVTALALGTVSWVLHLAATYALLRG